MSAIQDHQEVALRPVTGNSLSEVKALGQVFKASGYFKDIRDEAQAVTKILYGRELGFTPIVSIMGIYIIDGKPSLSSNLLATMIKRSGKYDYRVKENSATRCELEFRVRNDAGQWEPLGVTEFTMEEAKAAGVAGKDNWRKYPKAMLFARALSAGARAHCPDVSVCPIYVPEELGASVTEEGDVTELPKSAKPMDLTTEEIPLERPKIVTQSVATPDGQDTPANYHPAIEVLPPPENFFEKTKATVAEKQKQPKPDIEFEGCIDVNRKIAFSNEWFNACPMDWSDKEKEAQRLAWLKGQGFVGPDGVPTSAMIPMAVFVDTKRMAIRAAKALK